MDTALMSDLAPIVVKASVLVALMSVAAADPSASGLVLRITAAETEVREAQGIQIMWELENNGSSLVYVSQWPGFSLRRRWEGGPDGIVCGIYDERNLVSCQISA